jgi:hypothetical protein
MTKLATNVQNDLEQLRRRFVMLDGALPHRNFELATVLSKV